jgi:hypothetical protein
VAAAYGVAEAAEEATAAVYAVAEAAAAVYAEAEAAAVYAVAAADGAEGVGAARDAAAFWGRESAASGASEALPPYSARRPVHLRPCFLKRRPPGRLAGSTSCSRRFRPPSADCLWRLRHSR